MAYLIYKRETGEIRSATKNKVPPEMIPEGFALREYNGDLSKIHERRVSKNGQVIRKGVGRSKEEVLERAWKSLRRRRAVLLERCDWTQVADAPVDRAAWRKYRKALRDITKTTTDPTNVKWPEAPE